MLLWTCKKCGLKFHTDRLTLPVACGCGFVDWEGNCATEDNRPVQEDSPLVTRAVRWIGAATRWTLAGCPVRSDQEVEQIFREHCSPCPFFTGMTCKHHGCSCQVRDVAGEASSIVGRLVSTIFSNKLRWRTEKCPAEKWE